MACDTNHSSSPEMATYEREPCRGHDNTGPQHLASSAPAAGSSSQHNSPAPGTTPDGSGSTQLQQAEASQRQNSGVVNTSTDSPPASKPTGPTLDEVYLSIMASKNKTNKVAQSASLQAELPVLSNTSLMPIASLDQELSSTHLNIGSFASHVFGSSSLEQFDALIGRNDDMLFDLTGELDPEQQHLIERLQASGGEQARPQQVKALIRTMTVEKLFGSQSAGLQLKRGAGLAEHVKRHCLADIGRRHDDQALNLDAHLQRDRKPCLGRQQGQQGQEQGQEQGQGMRGDAEDGRHPASFTTRVFRSRTVEEFDALVGQNDDALFDLIGGLEPEQQQLIEELQAGGGAQQPQQVKALIRTLTVEKIFGDANHRTQLSQGLAHPQRRPGILRSLQAQHHSASRQSTQLSFQPETGIAVTKGSTGRLTLDLGCGSCPSPHSSSRHASPLGVQQQWQRQQQAAQGDAEWVPSPGAQQASQADMMLAMDLSSRADQLAAETSAMQGCLDMLLEHLDSVQLENHNMKMMILQKAAAAGIQAQVQHLDQTIAMHWPEPVPDEQAATLAAKLLFKNNGNLVSTVHQLLSAVLDQSSTHSAPLHSAPSPLQGMQQQPPSQQLQQLKQLQQQQQQMLLGISSGAASSVSCAADGTPALLRQDSLTQLLLQQPHLRQMQPQHPQHPGLLSLQRASAGPACYSANLGASGSGSVTPMTPLTPLSRHQSGEWLLAGLRRQPSLGLLLQRQSSLSGLHVQDALGGVGIPGTGMTGIGMPVRCMQL